MICPRFARQRLCVSRRHRSISDKKAEWMGAKCNRWAWKLTLNAHWAPVATSTILQTSPLACTACGSFSTWMIEQIKKQLCVKKVLYFSGGKDTPRIAECTKKHACRIDAWVHRRKVRRQWSCLVKNSRRSSDLAWYLLKTWEFEYRNPWCWVVVFHEHCRCRHVWPTLRALPVGWWKVPRNSMQIAPTLFLSKRKVDFREVKSASLAGHACCTRCSRASRFGRSDSRGCEKGSNSAVLCEKIQGRW
jgi:hypothetical protein